MITKQQIREAERRAGLYKFLSGDKVTSDIGEAFTVKRRLGHYAPAMCSAYLVCNAAGEEIRAMESELELLEVML